MKTIRLRPKAVQDLDEIWLYVADRDPVAADALIDRMTACFQALCRTSRMGRACPEVMPELRRFPVENYLVFYSVRDRYLIVERVLHGARDIERLFD